MGIFLKVCNLNFLDADDFQPFIVEGYHFMPICQKQPKYSFVITSKDIARYNRFIRVNAKVELPPRQIYSVLRRDGKKFKGRKQGIYFKLLDDILMIMSILIGRNVVLWSDRCFNSFPVVASKHCHIISKDSVNLSQNLTVAIGNILDPSWQKKFADGFHILSYYNCSDILHAESRFLANVHIWEFLYAHETINSGESVEVHYDKLRSTKLETKICYLLRKYLLNNRNLSLDKLKVFIYLRNQLTHYGKLPVIVPDAPQWIKNLGWEGCKSYLQLFERLTQSLVLRTIKINGLSALTVFNVQEHLEELVTHGRIQFYERLDK